MTEITVPTARCTSRQEFKARKALNPGWQSGVSFTQYLAKLDTAEPAKPAEAAAVAKPTKVCATEGCETAFTPRSKNHKYCPEHGAAAKAKVQERIDKSRALKASEDPIGTPVLSDRPLGVRNTPAPLTITREQLAEALSIGLTQMGLAIRPQQ